MGQNHGNLVNIQTIQRTFKQTLLSVVVRPRRYLLGQFWPQNHTSHIPTQEINYESPKWSGSCHTSAIKDLRCLNNPMEEHPAEAGSKIDYLMMDSSKWFWHVFTHSQYTICSKPGRNPNEEPKAEKLIDYIGKVYSLRNNLKPPQNRTCFWLMTVDDSDPNKSIDPKTSNNPVACRNSNRNWIAVSQWIWESLWTIPRHNQVSTN